MKSYTETSQRVMTSERYEQLTFQEQMFGSSEHHAKTSQSQDLEKDLVENDQTLSVKYSDLSKKKRKISPNGLYTKTLKECYPVTEGGTSYPYCLQWMNWGMTLNGRLSTQNISDCLRIGKECTLSDILEPVVASKLPITSTDGKNCHTKINIVGSTDPNRRIQQRKYIYGDDGLMGCMIATDYKEPKIVQVGRKEQRVFVKSNTVGGYEVAMIGDAINLAFPNSKTRRGRVGKEVAQTLDRSCNQGVFIQNGKEYVIRKLTPKECMRLQGVPDEYTDKLIKAGISDSQIYKAAGDGLSVPIAKEIGERIKKLT